MKLKAAIPIVALLSVPVPVLAQTNGAATQTPETPNATGEDLGAVPESMQIEQRVQRQFFQLNAKGPNATENQPSSDALGGARSSVERNRLDPAAPGRNRLQIDEGQTVRAIQNPSDSTPQTSPANPGTTYNTIIEGAPSSSGTSTGTSGTAGGMRSTMPSTSPGVGSTGSSGGLSSGSPSGGLSGGAAGGSSGGGASGGGSR
jgi:hypothetical protein